MFTPGQAKAEPCVDYLVRSPQDTRRYRTQTTPSSQVKRWPRNYPRLLLEGGRLQAQVCLAPCSTIHTCQPYSSWIQVKGVVFQKDFHNISPFMSPDLSPKSLKCFDGLPAAKEKQFKGRYHFSRSTSTIVHCYFKYYCSMQCFKIKV